MFYIKKEKPFSSAFKIIILSFLLFTVLYGFNKKIFVVDADTNKEAADILRSRSSFKETNYIISSYDNYSIEGYKYYYTSDRFCIVDIHGHSDPSTKRYYFKLTSKIDDIICYELFGSNLNNMFIPFPNTFGFHVALMGFYSSIILSLIIFSVIKLISSSENKIPAYGYIIIIVIIAVASLISLLTSGIMGGVGI